MRSARRSPATCADAPATRRSSRPSRSSRGPVDDGRSAPMSESGSSDRIAVHTNGHRPPLTAADLTVDAPTPDEVSQARASFFGSGSVTPVQAALGALVAGWAILLLVGRRRRGG